MLDQLIVWVVVALIGATLFFLIRANARHKETQRQLQRDIDALISRSKTEDEIRQISPDDRRRALNQWMRGEE